ncbi:MAG: transglutaminase domain-containing protein, partial [Chloroflexota bacterium]|nr:transglutaminase domain-containing protein [Chloroflexota bacterium]
SPASKGTVYEATSSVSVATEEELRRAGADYPAWVSDLYLQLSPSLTPRVRELSRELTRGASTPYEKARAIEDYLRTLGYRHEANPPPARADAVDHFLFTLREGHCDYFATAMAMMLRSAGVPARIAVGYSTGDWDSQEKTYVVRERHAHAWPEVFFPGLGWVKFEPTPSQPLIARGDPRLPKASEDEDLSLSNQGYLEEDDFLYGSGEAIPMLDSSPWEWGRIASVAGIALGSLTGIILLLLALTFLLWRLSLRGLGHGERCYENMCRLASWGRLAHQPQQTPQEYADALSSALPHYTQEIHHIAGCYTDMRYGRKALSDAECESLACAWQTLRGGLLRRLLRRS